MQLLDFLMARGRLDAVHRDRVLALRRERGESESVIVTRLGMIDEGAEILLQSDSIHALSIVLWAIPGSVERRHANRNAISRGGTE